MNELLILLALLYLVVSSGQKTLTVNNIGGIIGLIVSRRPTASPSGQPTLVPSSGPSSPPTFNPSSLPTIIPTASPSSKPTMYPTSRAPSIQPTFRPSNQPQSSPPTKYPSFVPTYAPNQILSKGTPLQPYTVSMEFQTGHLKTQLNKKFFTSTTTVQFFNGIVINFFSTDSLGLNLYSFELKDIRIGVDHDDDTAGDFQYTLQVDYNLNMVLENDSPETVRNCKHKIEQLFNSENTVHLFLNKPYGFASAQSNLNKLVIENRNFLESGALIYTSIGSYRPTMAPSQVPTRKPSSLPTLDPTLYPSAEPTYATLSPTNAPTYKPVKDLVPGTPLLPFKITALFYSANTALTTELISSTKTIAEFNSVIDAYFSEVKSLNYYSFTLQKIQLGTKQFIYYPNSFSVLFEYNVVFGLPDVSEATVKSISDLVIQEFNKAHQSYTFVLAFGDLYRSNLNSLFAEDPPIVEIGEVTYSTPNPSMSPSSPSRRKLSLSDKSPFTSLQISTGEFSSMIVSSRNQVQNNMVFVFIIIAVILAFCVTFKNILGDIFSKKLLIKSVSEKDKCLDNILV